MRDPISRNKILQILSGYNLDRITVGTLGSHSALEVCKGAKDESLQTIVVCQKGREKTYDQYYRVKDSLGRGTGVVDETIILNQFKDMLNKEIQIHLLNNNTIFIPNRSFTVYVPYDGIENELIIPIFGSRSLLRAEERNIEKNQYYLLEKAGIMTPHKFEQYTDIDTLSIVKVNESRRTYERAFFYASNPKEYEERSRELIQKGLITKASLGESVIEEFVLGAQYNFNFFYSPLLGELEFLGTDARRQTNLDGLLRLPADEQLKVLSHLKARNVEVGHFATTIRESLIDKIFRLGEQFVEATKREYPPGIIGPFALQGSVVPGPPDEEIVIFDVSLRIPGSPGTKFTHYTECRWGFSISAGRRIAMEIKSAANEHRMEEIVT
ncbi:MAG TPA: formate--phosphoribosylaminoimidazolecarboxamide ligase family protein [Nitrososphaerales archaeon]